MTYGVNFKVGEELFVEEAKIGMFKEDALKYLKGIVKNKADDIGEPVEYQLYEIDGKKRTTYPPETMKPRNVKVSGPVKEGLQYEMDAEKEKLKDEITRLQNQIVIMKNEYSDLEDKYKESVEEILKLKDLLYQKQNIIEGLQQNYNSIEKEMENLIDENKKMSKDLAYVAVEAIRLMGDMKYGKKN